MNANTALTMQTFQLLIMATQSHRQCRSSKMLPNKFSITKLGEGALIIRYAMINCFLTVLLLLNNDTKGHLKVLFYA